jgi:short-subunit dehydrogenase
MTKVLILGATSTIARAISVELAEKGYRLHLAGRSGAELERLASDLRVRFGIGVSYSVLDAEDLPSHRTFVTGAVEELGGVDGVVFAIGLLGNQPADSIEAEAACRLVEVNLTSAVSVLGPLANVMADQGSGFILGLSSVAGERGKQSNYVYCAAKAGFSTFLDGLRHRVESRGVKVYTLKLGFVDTAMTYGMEGLPLMVSPEKIARSSVRLLNKSSGIYYLPWFWRWIMLLIRCIPEPIFKRMKM